MAVIVAGLHPRYAVRLQPAPVFTTDARTRQKRLYTRPDALGLELFNSRTGLHRPLTQGGGRYVRLPAVSGQRISTPGFALNQRYGGFVGERHEVWPWGLAGSALAVEKQYCIILRVGSEKLNQLLQALPTGQQVKAK